MPLEPIQRGGHVALELCRRIPLACQHRVVQSMLALVHGLLPAEQPYLLHLGRTAHVVLLRANCVDHEAFAGWKDDRERIEKRGEGLPTAMPVARNSCEIEMYVAHPGSHWIHLDVMSPSVHDYRLRWHELRAFLVRLAPHAVLVVRHARQRRLGCKFGSLTPPGDQTQLWMLAELAREKLGARENIVLRRFEHAPDGEQDMKAIGVPCDDLVVHSAFEEKAVLDRESSTRLEPSLGIESD